MRSGIFFSHPMFSKFPIMSHDIAIWQVLAGFLGSAKRAG
jgi:hypothetical protein